MVLLREGQSIELSHAKFIHKKLRSTSQLVSFVRALDLLRERGSNPDQYLLKNTLVIQELALYYAKKENIDRTFFAYFISKNSPQDKTNYRPIMEILLSYLENSTVYCRENVLNALYALGNSYAVENALQIINERQWFHHQKLLSDGLITFTGDKEELANRLWGHLNNWDENLMVSVVQFITASSESFKERFYVALQEDDLRLEIRLAILRYFRRYYYEPVYPVLISYLKSGNMEDENIKIVTASVLDRYPGEETVKILKAALQHSNWYLRYNAASSLRNLKVTTDELVDILGGNDRYAKEILTYMIEGERRE